MSEKDKKFASLMGDFVELSVQEAALDAAISFIADTFEPDDIFSQSELETWAENNGYVKE